MIMKISKRFMELLDQFYIEVQDFYKKQNKYNGYDNRDITLEDFVEEFKYTIHSESMAIALSDRINSENSNT